MTTLRCHAPLEKTKSVQCTPEDDGVAMRRSPGNADILIVQKAVQSATTSKTVLIREDTDLIVLLCYHAILDSHDLYFCPEPKKNTKKLCVWNIRVTKESLVKTSTTTSYLFILFLGVTQCHVFIRLERGYPLACSKQAVCSMSRQRCLIQIQPPHMMC